MRKSSLTQLGRREGLRQVFPLAFEDGNPTLPFLLRRRGMHTTAVVCDGFSKMLTHGVGIERSFDDYLEADESLPRKKRDDSGNIDLVKQVFWRVPTNRRIFLWVHFFGPHSPNDFHPGTDIDGPTMQDKYDHEIRFLDAQLLKLWEILSWRGTPMVVVVAGDHGEVFADPIRMHGYSVSEEDIRVPLIIRAPGWKAGRVDQLVSLLDLFPTLLALTQTPAPTPVDGVDLAPWARDQARATERLLITETWRYDSDGKPIVDLITAFNGKRKVVLNTVDHSFTTTDQRLLRGIPEWVDRRSPDPLTRLILRYVEETGGALAPVE